MMTNEMPTAEKEMVKKWKDEFCIARTAGNIDKSHIYLDILYDWLMYRGVDVLSDIEFEQLRYFILDNDYL